MALQPEHACVLCGYPEGFAVGILGRLIGPAGEGFRSKAPLWVHRECAIWSPEAYETGDGHIRGISRVLKRGRVTWCAECQKRGATMGCRLDACQHSYHKYCATQAGCTFYPGQYLIACKTHAHLYSSDAPAGGQTPLSPYSPYPGARAHALAEGGEGVAPSASALGMKRLRETPPQQRLRNARRAVKRLRHEARAAHLAGSDDEEHFQNKDRARLVRDKLRLNPVILGQRRKPADEEAAAAVPPPTPADNNNNNSNNNNNVVSEGWAAVGGHAAVIQQLKEMVLLPLQYPEVFKHMGITPPRGILFYGSPGTGKTLVARALAGACSHNSSAPVTLFARKGADCLGKFAGEAERTLRLLFDEAARQAPSIIFLDELDGLVPARASNSSSSDQVFASVVATLLALMDGVTDRGAVVVIGATNRPEAIDPALRRPGRFDREVHFGLPSAQDRAAILKVHTSRWQTPPTEALLQRIAASTEGFAGADLQAICTAAVMAALTRSFPHLVDQLCHTAPGALAQDPVPRPALEHTAPTVLGSAPQSGQEHEPMQATTSSSNLVDQLCHTALGALAPDPLPQSDLEQTAPGVLGSSPQSGQEEERMQATVSSSNLVDQLCHTALGALAPDPVPQSALEQTAPGVLGSSPQSGQEEERMQATVSSSNLVDQLCHTAGAKAGQEQQEQRQATKVSPGLVDQPRHTALEGLGPDPCRQSAQERQMEDTKSSPGFMEQAPPAGAQNPDEQQDKRQQQQQQQSQRQQREFLRQQQQAYDHGQQLHESPGKLPRKLLNKLRVKAADWRRALATAPLPCSARQSLSALSSGHAKALPHHLVPLLLPCMSTALRSIAAAELPWPAATASAIGAVSDAVGRCGGRGVAGASQQANTEGAPAVVHADDDERAAARRSLESVLAETGVVQGASFAEAGAAETLKTLGPPPSGIPDPSHQQPTPHPCKLLLCGEEDAGQVQAAGALLKLVQGVQVHTISLPVLVLGGSGDTSAGLVQLMQEALRRASSHLPLVLYLPSIEAWALDTVTINSEEQEEGEAAGAGQAGRGPAPSRNAQPSITPLKTYPASISPFRGLVSLQARQGGSGGSRGNPPSGPTSARKATPAPARHLSFPHSSPDSHTQPSSSARAGWISPDPIPDGVASPTLSLPTPRAPKAAPHSPRPHRVSDKTPSIRARANLSSPGVTQAASPTLSLPSPKAPRAAPSSPALDPQLQESVHLSSKPFGLVQAPDAAVSADCLFSAEGTSIVEDQMVAEVFVLSEIWKVFEQVVKQIPATQPLLILATCQRHPEELPPVLLNFFQPQPPVATSAHYSPSQHDYTLTHQSFNGPQASSAKQVNSVGSCQVIVMESGAKAAPAGSWQEAVSRSAEAAAYAVAVAAAFSFQQKLLELASVLVGKEGLLGSGPRAFHSCNGQSIRPGHSPKGLDADAGRALGPAEGATVQCEVEIEQNPRKVASLGGGAVNENELQRGLELHAEVHRRIRLCGQRLFTDRRIKCARVPVRAPAVDPISPGAAPHSPSHLTTLAGVAQQAQQGHFHSLQAFAGAVRRAVAGICLAVEGRLARQVRQGRPASAGYSVRAAAACAVGDDVALWCHAITHQLALTQPASQRLLAVAQHHIASQQQQQQHAASQPDHHTQQQQQQPQRQQQQQQQPQQRRQQQQQPQQQQQQPQQQQPQPQQQRQQPQQQQQQQGQGTATELRDPAATTHLRGADVAPSCGLMTGSSTDKSSLDTQARTAQTARTCADASQQLEGVHGGSMDDGHGAMAGSHAEAMAGVDGADADADAMGVGDADAHVLAGAHALGVGVGADADAMADSDAEAIDSGDAQLPDISQQPGLSHQPAFSHQPGYAQQSGVSQQDSGRQHPSSSQQQRPAGACLQSRVGMQRSRLKVQGSLQAALLPILLEAVGKCRHSFQALLQCHDALISAALERLPAVADNLPGVLRSAPATEATDACLLHCQGLLVKDMQAFCGSSALQLTMSQHIASAEVL